MKPTPAPTSKSKVYSKDGLRMVEITETPGQISARLYLDAWGMDPLRTATCWDGKTVDGAQKWAKRILGIR